MSLVDIAQPLIIGKRAYEPIWELLKQQDIARLNVLPRLVPRVKKAVIKEKYIDAGFKLLLDHQGTEFYFLEFEYDKESQVLTIRLKQRYGVT